MFTETQRLQKSENCMLHLWISAVRKGQTRSKDRLDARKPAWYGLEQLIHEFPLISANIREDLWKFADSLPARYLMTRLTEKGGDNDNSHPQYA
jgi:hypothetical protein